MKILVTGAKGFVGKNLIATLRNIAHGKDRSFGDFADFGGSSGGSGSQLCGTVGLRWTDRASYHAPPAGRGESAAAAGLRSGGRSTADGLRPDLPHPVCAPRTAGGHRAGTGGRPLLHLVAAAAEGRADPCLN